MCLLVSRFVVSFLFPFRDHCFFACFAAFLSFMASLAAFFIVEGGLAIWRSAGESTIASVRKDLNSLAVWIANAAFLKSWFVFAVDVEDLIPVLAALAVVVVSLFGLPLLFQSSRKFDALDPLLGRVYLLGHDGYGEDGKSQANG